MLGRLKSVFSKVRKKIETETEKPVKQEKSKKEKKPSFVDKLNIIKKLEKSKLKKILEELEEELLTNNVAYSVTEELKETIKESKPKELKKTLEKKLKEILSAEAIDIYKGEKPIKLLFIGVNGVGKTTTLAKLASHLQKKKKKVVMAAGDTFRAAAIEQIQAHADKLKIKLIKHSYGSDAAAVAFDAIEHAKAKKLDYVLIDTAGRSHANEDLMRELEKIKRVSKPDFTILVVDSLTGNDAVDQAKLFGEKIGIDGVILTKADADERGGAIISVAHETGKPILFLGTGQEYKDLKEFNADDIIKQIL
jgi:fused signal recognition particle receptor